MKFRDRLKNSKIIIDGAMGTYYGQKYARHFEASETANLSNQEAVKKIHLEYIQAGAELIRTNTFSSNTATLIGKRAYEDYSEEQCREVLEENIRAGYEIAREAVSESGRDVWIAGDIGPVPEYGSLDDEVILQEYLWMADIWISLGAEIILFETFSDFRYISRVASFIKEKAPDIFVMTSFCLNKFGYSKSGISAKSLLETAGNDPNIDSIGFNCGIGAAHLYQIMKDMDLGDLIISAVPNSGYPDIIQDRNIYQENVDYFVDKMLEIDQLGVNMLGGCCGTNPKYIQKLVSELKSFIPAKRKPKSVSQDSGQKAGTENEFLKKLQRGEKVLVVELDPPHHANLDAVVKGASILKQAGVDMITFADSPMGKMRADSTIIGSKIQREIEVPVMPHISCRDKNTIALGSTFLGAHINGIRNMLIITGDPVPGGDRDQVSSVYDFNSIRLMRYLKQMNQEYFAQDPIVYGGALNYARTNIDKEIDRMKRKCEEGASYFLTQPIYSDEDIARIEYIQSKIGTKILCGIMPLVSYRNALFIKNEIYGINVPDEIVDRYRPDMSRSEGEETGAAIALELIGKMKDIADGFYFMVPFNRAHMIRNIIERMK